MDESVVWSAAAGESARIREALSSALSPVKLGMDAALCAPSYERRHAVGTPDYLAPELLLGALVPVQMYAHALRLEPTGCRHIFCTCGSDQLVTDRHRAWERGRLVEPRRGPV